MKVCIPVKSVSGLDSHVFAHLSSAPHFAIWEVDSKTLGFEENPNLGRIGSATDIWETISELSVDAVLVIGAGPGAVKRMNESGVRVLRAKVGTIQDNLEALDRSQLLELTPQMSWLKRGG